MSLHLDNLNSRLKIGGGWKINPAFDADTIAFATASGATDLASIDAIVRYLKAQSLFSSARLFPMKSAQNAGSGSTVYGLGGLSSNDLTIYNGAPWGADGIPLNGTTQYLAAADFLGGGYLYVAVGFSDAVDNDGTHNTLFSQWESTGDQRSTWVRINEGVGIGAFRSSAGDASSLYYQNEGVIGLPTSGVISATFPDSATFTMREDGTSVTLGATDGTEQLSRFNSNAAVAFGAINTGATASRLFTGKLNVGIVIDGASVSSAQNIAIHNLLAAL